MALVSTEKLSLRRFLEALEPGTVSGLEEGFPWEDCWG